MNIKNNIIQVLDLRIKAIEELLALPKRENTEEENSRIRHIELEISFFVHAIISNFETSLLFQEMLDYNKKFRVKDEYLRLKKEFNSIVCNISETLLSHPQFEKFANENSNSWQNVFARPSKVLITQLLNNLRVLENDIVVVPSSEIIELLKSKDGSSGIIDRFIKYDLGIFDNMLQAFMRLREVNNTLEYHEFFLFLYSNSSSALTLRKYYKRIIARGQSNKKIIIDKYEDFDVLLYHCKNLRNHLFQKLQVRYSIEVQIQRFKQYMELFHKSDFNKNREKEFHEMFELFMFNNGFYALSEGKIGNGRFDSVILDGENSFLCEYKQVGFDSSENGKKAIINKLKSAKIQSSIYFNQLKSFPGIIDTVFIIVFSNILLQISNKNSEIEKGGILFKFVIINLENTAPSKMKNAMVLDLEELIN